MPFFQKPALFDRIRSLYQRMAKTWIVLFSLIVSLCFIGLFAVLDSKRPAGTPRPIAIQFAFSEKAFSQITEQWGEQYKKVYKISLWIDYFFPMAYVILLSSSIARFVKSEKGPSKAHVILFVFPLIAGWLDWTENTLHLVLLAEMNHLSESLILLASIAALMKWGLVGFSIGVILYSIYRKIKLRRKVEPIIP